MIKVEKLPKKKFSTILADPPRQFQNSTGKIAPEHKRLNRYPTLDLEKIKALPVDEISKALERDNFINGWKLVDYRVLGNNYQEQGFYKDKFLNQIDIILEVERQSSYYVYKIILPIILILMVCWSVIWITPKEIESRLTVTIVCLLSLIAYNFVIDKEIPKLEYLTDRTVTTNKPFLFAMDFS